MIVRIPMTKTKATEVGVEVEVEAGVPVQVQVPPKERPPAMNTNISDATWAATKNEDTSDGADDRNPDTPKLLLQPLLFFPSLLFTSLHQPPHFFFFFFFLDLEFTQFGVRIHYRAALH